MKHTLCLVMLACAASAALAADRPVRVIAPGDPFPAIQVTSELSSAQRSYLGLPSGLFSFLRGSSFSVQDIDADVIVVEFFNNYCTSCQAQAPVMNSVFSGIEASPDLRGRVKLIGIGAGNSAREVASFGSTRQVAFPLIPDPDFRFYTAIGDPGGTPFTVILKKKDGAALAASVHKGLVHEPEYFLKAIEAALSASPAATPAQEKQPAAAPSPDRMFTLDMSAAELLKLVRGSMQRACPGCTLSSAPAVIDLPSGARVFRGDMASGSEKTVLYSQVVSRKPVCDVCHGIHFILTFNAAGTIVDFAPIHVTKYGNVLWQEAEAAGMRQKLVGRSLKQPIVFDPAVDAVSTATMSSALIFNSANNLGRVYQEIQEKGK